MTEIRVKQLLYFVWNACNPNFLSYISVLPVNFLESKKVNEKLPRLARAKNNPVNSRWIRIIGETLSKFDRVSKQPHRGVVSYAKSDLLIKRRAPEYAERVPEFKSIRIRDFAGEESNARGALNASG